MHGFNTRGSNVPDGILAPEGRFGRLFPLNPRNPTGDALAEQMMHQRVPIERRHRGRPEHEPRCGFYLLAQFIDHDLDFDPTSSLERKPIPTRSRISGHRRSTSTMSTVPGPRPRRTSTTTRPAGRSC